MLLREERHVSGIGIISNVGLNGFVTILAVTIDSATIDHRICDLPSIDRAAISSEQRADQRGSGHTFSVIISNELYRGSSIEKKHYAGKRT